MYPPLPKSYKGFYPFKLATTSFIYLDDYVPNVRMLGPYVDEIELLFFESAAGSLPSRAVIRELVRLGDEYQLSYNIHLPADIDPGSERRHERQTAVEVLQRVMDLAAPLTPSTHTLHLLCDIVVEKDDNVAAWQERTAKSLSALQSDGCPMEGISVETLEYPFHWTVPLLEQFNLGVCLDVGHLLLQDADLAAAWDTFGPRTAVIHLHGVAAGKDHLPLDRLSTGQVAAVMCILNSFSGVVSLELFGYRHLVPSLAFLEKVWQG